MANQARRSFLKQGLTGLAAVAGSVPGMAKASPAAAPAGAAPSFHLGLVTYELAKDWDIETIIKNCTTTGFEAVELRTTHKHGVELTLTKDRRAEVRQRFAGSAVRLLSLGSTCSYQYAQPALVEKNIEETRRWCELAHDLGCLGVKVRPNGFVKDVPHEKTLEQIGQALQKCGDAARDQGVEIWVEVHGDQTEFPPNIRRIMDACNHPAVGICWNCNDTDIVNGSVKEYFDLLKPWLRNCHINELWRTPAPWGATAAGVPEKAQSGFPSYAQPYPYRELFGLMRAAGYNRYTLAEVPESADPIRFMRYYRALWQELMA